MMAGERLSACLNRSRTCAARTPTNISVNFDPDRLKKGTPTRPDTARASKVLPVPGGTTFAFYYFESRNIRCIFLKNWQEVIT